jgi:alginate O-acetyltransferase complex protein AlgJ
MSTSAIPAEIVAPRTSARKWNRLLTGVFLAALLVPTLDLVFALDPSPSPARNPVVFPSLRAGRAWGHLPGEIIWYLKSAVGFRGSLVRARSLFAWRTLGVAPTPESVVRADPWLFLSGERVVDDFRRVDLFSPRELETWRSVLGARAAWLAARGIRYLVVVAPNKETIYADAVPPWYTRVSGPSRLAQLRAYLDQDKRGTEGDFLDLTDALAAHRADGRLYHLTDTHWDDRGAFIGYRAVAARLAAWFPSVRPLDDAGVVSEARLAPGGDLARMCGLKNDLLEPQEQLHLAPGVTPATFADGTPLRFERMDVNGQARFETRARQGEVPSAVIVRDSFGEALIPTLARHFQRATWVWTYDFPAELIDEQRPSVVIEELVERKLMILSPANPPELAPSGGPAATAPPAAR